MIERPSAGSSQMRRSGIVTFMQQAPRLQLIFRVRERATSRRLTASHISWPSFQHAQHGSPRGSLGHETAARARADPRPGTGSAASSRASVPEVRGVGGRGRLLGVGQLAARIRSRGAARAPARRRGLERSARRVATRASPALITCSRNCWARTISAPLAAFKTKSKRPRNSSIWVTTVVAMLVSGTNASRRATPS